MRKGTKMEATERIKGYCTEVNKEQWDELVRVAHQNGIGKGYESKEGDLAFLHLRGGLWLVKDSLFNQAIERELIPFPDFLAKLRGEEEWRPKAGEMVEVSHDEIKWFESELIAESRGQYIAWLSDGSPYLFKFCRPIIPTITRAEAEKQLGKRIID